MTETLPETPSLTSETNMHNLDLVRNIKTELRHFQAGMTVKQVAMYQAIESMLIALEYDLQFEEPTLDITRNDIAEN